MVFHEMSHFLQLFSEKFLETSKGHSLLEKLPVLAKSMLFRGFLEMSHFLQLFSEKFIQISKGDSLLKKLPVLVKFVIFDGFTRNEPLFATFFRKVHRNLEKS